MTRILLSLGALVVLAMNACSIQVPNGEQQPTPAGDADKGGDDDDGSSDPTTTSPSGKRTTTSSSSSSDTKITETTTTTNTGSASLPKAVEIAAPLASGLKAFHSLSDDKKTIVSFLTVTGKPTMSPKPSGGQYPALFEGDAKVVSPDPGNCKVGLSFTYNSSEVGVQISGVDSVPASTDCTKFTDAVAKNGLEAIVTNAPWSNVPSSSKDTVTVTVKFD